MDNTKRFSDRVADYRRYRPSYPEAVTDHLRNVGYLFDGAVVADVGAGTGIFTDRLVAAGAAVIAVEPNEPMAAALRSDFDVRCVLAPAEATTLDDQSVDLVTAAQALHWFDAEATRPEFRRITRPPHRLAAVWNRRDVESTGFLRAYEALLQEHGLGYSKMMAGRDALEASLEPWFGHAEYKIFTTPNVATHDWDGLVGRLLSSSYGPKPGHPAHEMTMHRLREIFEASAEDGRIEIRYDCRVYFGEIR